MSQEDEKDDDIEMEDDNQSSSRDISEQPQERRQPRPRPQVRRNPLASRQELGGMNVDTLAVRIRQRFQNFLRDYADSNGTKVYVEQLETMEQVLSNTLEVDWNHLRPIDDLDSDDNKDNFQDLSDHIQSEYYRFEPYLREAVKNHVKQFKPGFVRDNNNSPDEDKEFYISISNFPDVSKLRELQAKSIGTLCSLEGTVTRTSEVRPELVYGTFKCSECGTKIVGVLQQFKYTEPTVCPNQQCQNRKGFELQVSESKFVDWQKIRVQENSSDIPPGSMPRSIDIIVREDQIEKCKPGDKGKFTGSLIVVPSVSSYYNSGTAQLSRRNNGGGSGALSEGVTGLKVLGVRDLNYRLVFLSNHVKPTSLEHGTTDIREDSDKKEGDLEQEFYESLTNEQRSKLKKMINDNNIYTNLAKSIAPNIFGHLDIKRGILLMLMGGVKKTTKDKVSLRGDINICIVGDPSTAKSQFLKYVTKILPRTIYTSGKASTSAGLTASVMRDPETGEFGIEAGALMLADNGIACIDEFDKMDNIDQAAIHEAMEQQTITITKAGIHATLNARASILAAANPMWGRYDSSKPLRYNINLTAPIMSRFDLFFIVQDDNDDTIDLKIATHILKLHAGILNKKDKNIGPYDIDSIQLYIKFCRSKQPIINQESKKLLVQHYRKLRQRDQNETTSYRFTVRQLESLIRLSEALARVHFSSNVQPRHVNEAARLLENSIITVKSRPITIENPQDENILPRHEKTRDIDDDDDNKEEKKDTEETDTDNDEDDDDDDNQQIEITFDKYVKITKMLVYHIRKNEESYGAGLKQSKLENIILEEHQQLTSTDIKELTKNLKIVQWIIHRVITHDHILIIKTDNEDSRERILIVHPNYDTDSNNTQVLTQESSSPSNKQKKKTRKKSDDISMTEKSKTSQDDQKDEEENQNQDDDNDDDDDIDMID